jgi:hypothetical protein
MGMMLRRMGSSLSDPLSALRLSRCRYLPLAFNTLQITPDCRSQRPEIYHSFCNQASWTTTFADTLAEGSIRSMLPMSTPTRKMSSRLMSSRLSPSKYISPSQSWSEHVELLSDNVLFMTCQSFFQRSGKPSLTVSSI